MPSDEIKVTDEPKIVDEKKELDTQKKSEMISMSKQDLSDFASELVSRLVTQLTAKPVEQEEDILKGVKLK